LSERKVAPMHSDCQKSAPARIAAGHAFIHSLTNHSRQPAVIATERQCLVPALKCCATADSYNYIERVAYTCIM